MLEDILILLRGETFNSQFASFFVSFDAEVNTYTMRILFFLLFSKNGKKLCLQRDMEMPKRKDKRKKLISNTVQNALDK